MKNNYLIISFLFLVFTARAQDFYNGKFGLGTSIGWVELATFDLAGNGNHNSVIIDAKINYVRTSELGYSATAKLFLREGTSQNGKWNYNITGTQFGDYLKFKKINTTKYGLYGFSPSNYGHISIDFSVTKEAPLIVDVPTSTTWEANPDIYSDVPKVGNASTLVNNLGVGTIAPKSKVHIYNGSSGQDPHSFADLSVEDNEDVMISLLTYNTRNAYYGFADTNDGFVGGIQYNHPNDIMYFRVNNHSSDMVINKDGNVGIGTTNPGIYKLAVKGKIRAEEIKVETGWADYVFKEDYDLPTLEEVENHIKEKGHLINISSANEVEENGVQLGQMNKLLLEKIEELTLYTLRQQAEINALKKEIKNKK